MKIIGYEQERPEAHQRKHDLKTDDVTSEERHAENQCGETRAREQETRYVEWPIVAAQVLDVQADEYDPDRPFGTLMKKIQRQWKYVVMKPPTSGPNSGPSRGWNG
ncbi:MAG: hypothetical protein WDN29_09545 [Methylovirgula sp.]